MSIGKSIIEEQGGNEKAEYGTGLLKELSKQMTQDFGKGFTVANLKNMRQFYLTFPNSYALRSELSWTHYRLLMRVENENAREFYMQEAVKSQWSTRQLERQINSFFYERLLSSKNKEQVAAEIQTLEPDFGLFVELLAEHLEVHHGLLVQNNHSLTGFGFRRLGNLLAIHIDGGKTEPPG